MISPSRDEYTRELLQAQAAALSKIETLVDVPDAFRDTIHFVVHRVLSNIHAEIFLYQVSQLSELGTGFNSTFENGGTQSDLREDVILGFMAGGALDLRIRGKEFILRDRALSRTHPLPCLERGNRVEVARIVDGILAEWWCG